MANPAHLVIDCDPGCDDALALLMAFNSKRYQQIDILTVAGNVGVNQTTENACKVAFLAHNKDQTEVAVYKGCAASLEGLTPSAASVHGRDGLGDVPDRVFLEQHLRPQYLSFRESVLGLAQPKRTTVTAAERYWELFRNQGGNSPRHLICTGPLTNLASFLINVDKKEHINFWESWQSIVFMTGALYVRGNISYHGEFNAYADPLALRVVLDSFGRAQGKSKKNGRFPMLCLVTLDITEKLNLFWEELDEIRKGNSKLGVINDDRLFKFVSCMLQKYFLFHGLFAEQADRYCRYFEPSHVVKFACTKQKCGHRRKDCKDVESFRRKRFEEFREARRLGSGGLKHIPRFCQLHDPLAVYVALNYKRMPLKPLSVYVSPELGTTRGNIQAVEPRSTFFEIESGSARDDAGKTRKTHGKGGHQRSGGYLLDIIPEVQVIDEEKFMASRKSKFLRNLKSAVGVKIPRNQRSPSQS